MKLQREEQAILLTIPQARTPMLILRHVCISEECYTKVMINTLPVFLVRLSREYNKEVSNVAVYLKTSSSQSLCLLCLQVHMESRSQMVEHEFGSM